MADGSDQPLGDNVIRLHRVPMEDSDLGALHEAAVVLEQYGYHELSVQVFAITEREA